MSAALIGRTLSLGLLVVALLAFSAPALRDRPPPAPASSARLEPAPPTPTPTEYPSGRAGGQGTLVLIQGLKDRRLVVAALDGATPPHEVDRSVSTWPLLPSPSGAQVLYSTPRTLMSLDLAARRAVIVGTLPEGGQAALAQWSPDEAAIAYVVATDAHHIAYYTRADGSQDAAEMLRVPRGLPLDVGWSDGRPVAIALGIGPVGGLQATYYLYHPAGGVTRPLPPEAAVVQPWAPWRSPDGRQQVYAAARWERARSRSSCRTGPLGIAGAEWLYLSARDDSSEHRILFEQRDLYMDRPTWLADGRILFRALADEVCTALPSGLYVARLGETPALLIESSAGARTEGSDRLLWSLSYALHEDDLVWSENDLEAERSAVYAAPVGGGAARLLYETPRDAAAAPFAYRDREAILTFVWLP